MLPLRQTIENLRTPQVGYQLLQAQVLLLEFLQASEFRYISAQSINLLEILLSKATGVTTCSSARTSRACFPVGTSELRLVSIDLPGVTHSTRTAKPDTRWQFRQFCQPPAAAKDPGTPVWSVA